MELKKTITENGIEKNVKDEMPDISKIINAAKQRGLFNDFTRYRYIGEDYDIESSLKLVEAIGKARNPGFVIDSENRFAYENFIRWCHGDEKFMCINPFTHQPMPGDLRKGIYLAGNTGSGKSWCLEIMLAYSMARNFGISFADDERPRPMIWNIARADDICDKYVETGSIIGIKKMPMLGIQDFGQEPAESLYMGNRLDVIRQLVEYRGDCSDELTFITTNLKMGGEKLIQRYGDRVASRLNQMCNNLEIKGRDRRKMWNTNMV